MPIDVAADLKPPDGKVATLLANLDIFYKLLSQPAEENPRTEILELFFNQSEFDDLSFLHFIEGLIESLFWREFDYSKNPYRTLCLDFAAEVDRLSTLREGEPDYHSRRHFKDVCLALSALLIQKPFLSSNVITSEAWHLQGTAPWILLLSAIGHDYGHDGSVNQFQFEMEKKSIELAYSFFKTKNLKISFIDQLINQIEPIILATDPSYYSTLIRRVVENPSQLTQAEVLSILLVESDLMASVMPNKGVELGNRLGAEWEKRSIQLADIVKTKRGRLGFLERLTYLSPQSASLGVPSILNSCIQSIKLNLSQQNE